MACRRVTSVSVWIGTLFSAWQATTQAPQPVHLSRSIDHRPFMYLVMPYLTLLYSPGEYFVGEPLHRRPLSIRRAPVYLVSGPVIFTRRFDQTRLPPEAST